MTLRKKLLKIALTLQICFWGISIFGQSAEIESPLHEIVKQQTDEIFESLVKIRRDFHTYPELSGQEKRTSKKVEEYLLSIGLEVKTNIGGYGVVGILKGDKEGKRIAWRADMDALPSEIPGKEEFKSKNKGVRHICGHDVNTTIALGIANVLASQKEKLAGTVYFIFQPSEENYKGAKAMIDDGLFDLINPDEIYGLHITPMAVGQIATKPELPFADYKTIKVSLRNTGENDSIISYTKKLISGLQNVEPDSQFWDNSNLLDPNIGLGNPNTIYKDYLTVSKDFNITKTDKELSVSSVISSDKIKKMDSVILVLKQRISASKFSKKLISVDFPNERAVVNNDKNLTTKTMKSIAAIYGDQNVIPLYGAIPDGRGDDFAYFQQHIPGAYFLLGGSNFEKGIISMPHSPEFAVDESSLYTGVQFFSSMIIERLKIE